MRQVQQLQIPTQALQLGQYLMNNAQEGLAFNEQKRQNQATNKINNSKLGLEQKKYQLDLDKYNNELETAKNKAKANGTLIKNLYPKFASSVQSAYGDNPTIENQNAMNNIFNYANPSDLDKVAGRDWDKNKFNTEMGFKVQDANIKNTIAGANAGKPSEASQITAMMMGQPIPQGKGISVPKIQLGGYKTPTTDTYFNTPIVTQPIQQTASKPVAQPVVTPKPTPQPVVTQPTIETPTPQPTPKVDWNNVEVGHQTKKATQVDILTKDKNEKFTLADGSTVERNPITGREVLTSKPTLEEKQKVKNLDIKTQDEIIGFKNDIGVADETISKIDALLGKKDFNSSFGAYAPLGYIPNTDRYDIHADLDTIENSTFLSAIGAMKGMGSLSNAEGQKIASAMANLGKFQSPENVRKNLNVIKASLTRLRQMALDKMKIRGQDSYEEQQKKDREDLKNRVRQELGL